MTVYFQPLIENDIFEIQNYLSVFNMNPSSEEKHVDNPNGTANPNIRQIKILNESDLREFEHSPYENEGTPIAVESVALVSFISPICDLWMLS